MFKVIESKEEFIAAVRAYLLWGDRSYPNEAPQWDHLLYFGEFSNRVLIEIWDDADNNVSDDFSWRTQDFAVLVEDDGEDTSPPTASKDYQL